MTWQHDIEWLWQQVGNSENEAALHHLFSAVGGSHQALAVLQRAIRWSATEADEEGWFYMYDERFQASTRLDLDALKEARRRLFACDLIEKKWEHSSSFVRVKASTVRKTVEHALRKAGSAGASSAGSSSPASSGSTAVSEAPAHGAVTAGALAGGPLGRAGVVYLLQDGSSYQIGQTTSIEAGLAQVRLQIPLQAELVHTVRTNDVDWLQRHWHNHFAARRSDDGTFDLTAADLDEFMSLSRLEVTR